MDTGVFLTTPEAAALLRVKPSTLRIWRWRGVGPAHTRAGARVLYERGELLRWLASRTVTPTIEPTPAEVEP